VKTNSIGVAARALGIPIRDVGNAVERIKQAVGLHRNAKVEIDTDNGEVSVENTGEWVGNIYDELGYGR